MSDNRDPVIQGVFLIGSYSLQLLELQPLPNKIEKSMSSLSKLKLPGMSTGNQESSKPICGFCSIAGTCVPQGPLLLR